MEEAAHFSEERKRILKLGRERKSFAGQTCEPAAYMDIAQTTGTVFNIRLQVEKRVAIPCVPLACQFNQRMGERSSLTIQHSRKCDISQFCRKALVSGKEAKVQQRKHEFSISGVITLEISQHASCCR